MGIVKDMLLVFGGSLLGERKYSIRPGNGEERKVMK